MSNNKWSEHKIIELIEEGQADERFELTSHELKSILNKREALPKAITWMESNIDVWAYEDARSDGVMTWENVGLFFFNNERLFEAIIVFQKLYDHICEAELRTKKQIHKGMPLVSTYINKRTYF